MKTVKRVIWGLVFVIVGILLCLNALDLFDFDIFFEGWWTLFIIVPCAIGIITDDNKSGSIFFLIIGILLLLAAQDVISYKVFGKLIWPLILLMIGLSLLFKNMFNKSISKAIAKINSTNESKEEYSAIFSGQDIDLEKVEFKGTTLNAIFGGMKLDLRKAVIKKDVVITGKAIFGGIDIYTPDDVNVQVKSNSVFGGVENKNKNDDKKITIYIDATCVFGGIDVK